jgi:hypothetical protein
MMLIKGPNIVVTPSDGYRPNPSMMSRLNVTRLVTNIRRPLWVIAPLFADFTNNMSLVAKARMTIDELERISQFAGL